MESIMIYFYRFLSDFYYMLSFISLAIEIILVSFLQNSTPAYSSGEEAFWDSLMYAAVAPSAFTRSL